ncbi:3-hydroxyacyl-CoA dehydrogenase family protein [Cytobacillus firmus]|nr:3-hydroxyacyl-CoA dehydrogenase family protein [Cytobacillus firmus]
MIFSVAVIGAGVMGHGIAQSIALSGTNVNLYDLNREALIKARSAIEKNLNLFVKYKLIEPSQREMVLKRVHFSDHLEDCLVNSNYIIEAIPEIVELKWDLYSTLEKICSEDTIIASNTSTIPLTTLTQHSLVPERFIIAHFLNPAPLVPLVEVVKQDITSKATIQKTLTLLEKIGKSPVLLKKEVPGFIANRLQAAVLREALYLMNEGVADAADLDSVMKNGPGFRWAFIGPIETADYGGLDTWKRVLDNLSGNLNNSAQAPEMINELVKHNQLGVKTGKGIYNYEDVSIEEKVLERDESFLNLLKLKEKNASTHL